MTIIAGCLYYRDGQILRPIFSGDFYVVTCTVHRTKADIEERYSERNAAPFLARQPITYQGQFYYECDNDPVDTNGMILLSDISGIKYLDSTTDFN